jgi:hypothetical protein
MNDFFHFSNEIIGGTKGSPYFIGGVPCKGEGVRF